MRLRISLLIVTVAFPGVACTVDKNPSFDKNPSLSVDEAIRLVSKPAWGLGNMSPFELQVYYRLAGLSYQGGYNYQKSHAASWKSCMLDERQDMYARLCAAYFLLDHDEKARGFVKGQLVSKSLRHRYNAAQIIQFHVGRDSSRTWGVNTLIKLLADGSLDGSRVSSSTAGTYPDGDGDETMFTPIDTICWDLGFMRERKAVPALISVLQRRPTTDGAAFALGEIGDKRAIPVLLKVLKERSSYDDREVTALGKLKCREAVPILIKRLGHPKTTFSGLDIIETEQILEALLAIGDKRAVAPIEEYSKGEFPKESKAVARRVLVQLKSGDPVHELLELLKAETYEPERSDIIEALVGYKDNRVVQELSVIARTSGSAFMRREAIFGLQAIGDRRSLLVLASLLDVKFSKDLKAEWGWKATPDFRKYFPETIAMCLEQRTKQHFGKDRSKWEAWITKNVKQDAPADADKPRR